MILENIKNQSNECKSLQNALNLNILTFDGINKSTNLRINEEKIFDEFDLNNLRIKRKEKCLENINKLNDELL